MITINSFELSLGDCYSLGVHIPVSQYVSKIYNYPTSCRKLDYGRPKCKYPLLCMINKSVARRTA